MEEEKRAHRGAFFRSGVYSAFEDTESQTRFLKTVARYNELCRRGRDTDFGRDTKLLRPLERGPVYACGQLKDAC